MRVGGGGGGGGGRNQRINTYVSGEGSIWGLLMLQPPSEGIEFPLLPFTML